MSVLGRNLFGSGRKGFRREAPRDGFTACQINSSQVRTPAIQFNRLTWTPINITDQHVDLQISQWFLESYPVQAEVALVPQPQAQMSCAVIVTSQHKYDLTPLKEIYSRMYQSESGSVFIKGIADYTFSTATAQTQSR